MCPDLYTYGGEDSPTVKRKIAVEAVLDLIYADRLGKNNEKLPYHMDRWSDYTDKIQDALKISGD